ncbi:MAG: DUF4867 family protein [Candidatus Limiplasma sp.]|nr:DUF4867 family protein [Candidatus Limiplasma sp.]
MDMLARLRSKNPSLALYSVEEEAFRPYGRVAPFEAGPLVSLARSIPMPQAGSAYVMSHELLQSHPDSERIRDVLMGEAPVQVGLCWGVNRRLEALEYHRGSEFNIAVTDLVLVLAARQEIEEGMRLDLGKAKAFYVPAGTTLEVYGTTLHYCPCQCAREGFSSVVILPQGTNGPLERGRQESGEGRLLFARDKWLLCHEDNEGLIKRGAFPGLYGNREEIAF